MDYIFLHEYSADEKRHYCDVLDQCINRLPYTLASPIGNVCLEVGRENYGKAMNYMLDFFEISTQYLFCVLYAKLSGMYVKQGSARAVELHKFINRIDSKRPLAFGDWVNDLFCPIVGLAAKEFPDDALCKSLQANVVNRKKNILLGDKRNPSVVNIRNRYKGHTTTLSEALYHDVVFTLEERMLVMASALLPLTEWHFVSRSGDKCLLLNGMKPVEVPLQEIGAIMQPGHYYVSSKALADAGEEDLLDLFPLVHCSEKGYIYVFQSLKGEYITFVSSNVNALNVEDDCYNEHLDAYFQKILPTFDVAKDLNWDAYKDLMKRESNRFLAQAYSEKKYNAELFVDQKRLSQYLQQFVESDKTLFPLLGEAGQGKTNQLCYWTESRIRAGKAVLTLPCANFVGMTLEEKLKEVFGTSVRRPIGKLLADIQQKADSAGEEVCIFFDAINECLAYGDGNEDTQSPLRLYDDIKQVLVKGGYSRIKVLFTCRSYTWKNLLQTGSRGQEEMMFTQSNEDDFAVRGFNDEELKEAYHIYGQLYQMQTSFAELKRNVVIRLKDPLVLKMACTNYLNAPMPADTIKFTSLSLFHKMWADVGNSYAGRRQCEILGEIARYMLGKYEHGVQVDSVQVHELKAAYLDEQSELHALARLVYKKDGISVAYGELLNKPERPILRSVEATEGKGRSIQFIYERFLEYMLAITFVGNETVKLAQQQAPIPAKVYIDKLHSGATNVVYIGALRNGLLLDYLRTGSTATIIELASKYSDDYEVMHLLTEVMDTLVRENYEKQLFALIDNLISENLPDGGKVVAQFNKIDDAIANDKAGEDAMQQYIELYEQLSPIIKLRRLALVGTLNGIFLTDYFNEDLYSRSPMSFLWRLMTDPIGDVKNDACMYAYYLSNKKYTQGLLPLKENLCERVVGDMFDVIKGSGLLKMVCDSRVRKHNVVFIETSIRLCVLMIIDALLSGDDNERVKRLLGEVTMLVKHLTCNFMLVRMMMPFIQIALRRQLTFQTDYVNNIIEYQTFWDDATVPATDADGSGRWNRSYFKQILESVFTPYVAGDKERAIAGFAKCRNMILSAYICGDSFSYFMLERLLVIVGSTDIDALWPVVNAFFSDEFRGSKWFDYSQMSMLYILYQLEVNSPSAIDEIQRIYARESMDWTYRCRGFFAAHNSHKANAAKVYKRNVMNWYCVVYCHHSGDNVPHAGDERCVPVFYELLEVAMKDGDKVLLYHLLENISELITDHGYIHTALSLLKYILEYYDCAEKVKDIDSEPLSHGWMCKKPLAEVVGNVLATAKNYFPQQVDSFIKKDLLGLGFPCISKYREEILNYNPSGETLSDLFTHRFGNFLMWALLHEEAVDSFACEAMLAAPDADNCFKWFNQVVRILFKHLFNVKL